MQIVTATGLSAWASYLINGDDSGITPDDKHAADAFAKWMGATPCNCEDAGFMWTPDSFQFMEVGGDCQRYEALV